jgi:tRNA (cytidine/uridine-2'-O-)-methyltransferase
MRQNSDVPENSALQDIFHAAKRTIHLAGSSQQAKAFPMRLALFEPDIPQNTAAIIRLGACLGVPVDIIEPCGFLFSDAGFRRAGLDYLERGEIVRHASWPAFREAVSGRLVLFTTKPPSPYTDFAFASGDTLLFGRESVGVPENVHTAASARIRIPLRPGLRSLNVAQAAAMALGEALRQTGGFMIANCGAPGAKA